MFGDANGGTGHRRSLELGEATLTRPRIVTGDLMFEPFGAYGHG